MDLGLVGKTAFVTGASGGIGSEIARGFVREGAAVVVHCHRNVAAADALAREIGSQHSLPVQADLTDEQQVDAAFRQAADHFGSIDILVVNAGIWPPESVPIADMSLEQWQTTLSTNLTSAFLCSRKFLRWSRESATVSPSIVLIGSTAAVFGEAGHGDYASSKSGLVYGFMLTLKNEIARHWPGGRVNAVCPGWTVTPMTEMFVENHRAIQDAISTIALRKVASPGDIANAVLFLASPQVAGHITGQVLVVSGGMEGRKLFADDELDVQRAIPEIR